MTISIFGIDIQIDSLETMWETFNPLTVLSGGVTGFLFGFLAFVPLMRLMAPEGPPPGTTPKQAFWATFAIIVIALGAVLTVYYSEQIVTEIFIRHQLSMRAVGRYLTFLVFLLAFATGVGLTVYREFKHPHEHDSLPTGGTDGREPD